MTTASGLTNKGADALARVAAYLLIYSDVFAPEEITSQLDLQPTRTTEKGVKYGKRTGTQMNIPRHLWMLSSESHLAAKDLTSHLDWLLARLFPIRERLRALRESGAIDCHLRGVVWTSNDGAHVQLPIRVMEMLVELQLEPELEFADYGDDK
jgi:Domain of unknown function (DUF4279)